MAFKGERIKPIAASADRALVNEATTQYEVRHRKSLVER